MNNRTLKLGRLQSQQHLTREQQIQALVHFMPKLVKDWQSDVAELDSTQVNSLVDRLDLDDFKD